MGFKVDEISYFLVCNANIEEEEFNKKINFDEFLIPYKWNVDWIEDELEKMLELMNSKQIPKANKACKNCAYAEQYASLFCQKNI
tara:strand:- start:99 stop:353 length:255 start_codon:yes stop_codon:yes gene_type:complete